MNAKTLCILLLVITLALGGAWWKTSQDADKDRREATLKIEELAKSNQMTFSKLTEQKAVNMSLELDLVKRAEEIKAYSNKWTTATSELTKAELQARAAAAAAREEINQQNQKINALAGEKDELSKKMDGLNAEISGLNGQIKETEAKLAASEGDRAVLEKELKRLVAEKAELERKFNDLAVLKKQVQRLKDELSISKRLEFIRRGLYGFDKKGAEVLNEGVRPKVPGSNGPSGIVLNATIGTDGSAKVDLQTNAPVKAP